MVASNPVDAVPAVGVLSGVVTTKALATFTLPANQVVNGVLVLTAGSASTVTTDTAANIIKALKGCQTFEFIIDNGSGNTVTLAGGTGVTIVNGGTVTGGQTGTTTTTGFAHMYSGVVASPTSVKLYSVSV